MKYKVAQIPSVGMMVIEDENGILMSPAEVAGLLNSLEQRIAAANGRLEEYEEKICNCRWEGETLVRQCELHEAHVDAIHEWAERAKVAEQRLAAAEAKIPKWIPVSERLPQKNEFVLFIDGKYTLGGCERVYVDKIVESVSGCDCFENYLHNYTHWMPLPEPPNNGENAG